MALILICVNILASYFHGGLDLTRENRFTLSKPTRRLLANMQEVAVIEVYLKGKFPADMQRMQEAVRERLASFKDLAGNKIIYRFTDPFEGKSEAEQKQIVQDLHQKGIEYLQLPTQEEEGYSVKVCFPYALLQYNGKEKAISLLETPPGKNREEIISYSEAMLEYKFASAINELQRPVKPYIAYIFGNNEEMNRESTVDMLGTLGSIYRLDSLNLSRVTHISTAYDAIIINQPTHPFSGPDKLKIDQYVMRGGHILWALKNMNAAMDSFGTSQQFMSTEMGIDLDDILFKYGVRINNDLVEDLQDVPIGSVEMNTRTPRGWVYFPRINPTGSHPIIHNMGFIMGGFSSSIDTILTSGIKKTILLTSSQYSRVASSPVRVNLMRLFYPGSEESFNKPYRPLAVLMEGKFHSVYQNRLAPEYLRILDSLHEPFKPACDSPTSMIVTSIGNVFENDFSTTNGPMKLGYNKYAEEFFANKSFLLNSIEYLTDHSGILEARSKDTKPRLLDVARAKTEKSQWQWINVCVPIGLVLVFASCYTFFRKRKYEVKHTKPKTTAANA